ncbi:MAG TPA: hypothetical protein VH105_02080 [Burkholderiales bacterium]|nr:hypothetical protein [Burkholderiales bacterium]
MKSIVVSGIALIVIGIALLGQYSYTTEDSIFKLGPIEAKAERQHTFALPPAVGWALMAGGIVVLVVGGTRKR